MLSDADLKAAILANMPLPILLEDCRRSEYA